MIEPAAWIYINNITDITVETAKQLSFYYIFIYLLGWLGVVIPALSSIRDNGLTVKDIHILAERAKSNSHHLLEDTKAWTSSSYHALCAFCNLTQDRVLHIYDTRPRRLTTSKSTQTLHNEIVFYNPQEPLNEELSALLVSRYGWRSHAQSIRSFSSWKSTRRRSRGRSGDETEI